MDEDEKVRRNVVTLSTAIIFAAWLEVDEAKVLASWFKVPDATDVHRLWQALFVALGYVTLRYTLNDRTLEGLEIVKRDWTKSHRTALCKLIAWAVDGAISGSRLIPSWVFGRDQKQVKESVWRHVNRKTCIHVTLNPVEAEELEGALYFKQPITVWQDDPDLGREKRELTIGLPVRMDWPITTLAAVAAIPRFVFTTQGFVNVTFPWLWAFCASTIAAWRAVF